MIADFESFKIELSLSKVEICRELYHQNRDLIRIKKEQVAVKNLVRIINSTLRLAGSKGFHAMSLRDLCADRSEEHTSELQSLMRISYAVFCLKKKKTSTCYNTITKLTQKHDTN